MLANQVNRASRLWVSTLMSRLLMPGGPFEGNTVHHIGHTGHLPPQDQGLIQQGLGVVGCLTSGEANEAPVPILRTCRRVSLGSCRSRSASTRCASHRGRRQAQWHGRHPMQRW